MALLGNRLHFSLLLTLCVVVGLSLPVLVWAEAGDGVKTDSLRIHPGIAIGAGYNTNVFRQSAEEEGRLENPGAPHLSIAPELSMESLDTSETKFSFDATAAWEHYLAFNSIYQEQSGLSTTASIEADFNRDGDVGFTLREFIERLNQPPSGVGGEPINRIWNEFGFRLNLRPGARLLNASIGYDWNTFFYESFVRDNLNKNLHEIGFETNWQFLPETEMLVMLDYHIIRYQNEFRRDDVTGVGTEPLKNINSSPLRIRGGLRGLVTPRISIKLVAGYAAAHYEEGDNFNGPIGYGELIYQFGRSDLDNRIEVGYRRDFDDSSLGNYYHYHQTYARYQQEFFGGRLQFSLAGDFQLTNYPDIGGGTASAPDRPVTGLPTSLQDTLVGANSALGWQVAKWGRLRLKYLFEGNFTSSDVAVASAGIDQPHRSYRQHKVLLSTLFRY